MKIAMAKKRTKLPFSLEKDIQKACVALFELNRWVCTRVSATPLSKVVKGKTIYYTPKSFKAGTADYICGVKGMYLAVEFKRPGKKQRTGQKEFQTQVHRAGCLYVIISSIDEAEALVRRMKGQK